MLRHSPRKEPYEVIVVGSGAGGGVSAYVLSPKIT